ncbi:uncharacterized protein [Clytia hemisphaerica]|uniref:uncharacterized protein isoform X1 n=1 Tax=Clytia hemisphaerica TaxID=252671 RepID=UPI0034D46BD0
MFKPVNVDFVDKGGAQKQRNLYFSETSSKQSDAFTAHKDTGRSSFERSSTTHSTQNGIQNLASHLSTKSILVPSTTTTPLPKHISDKPPSCMMTSQLLKCDPRQLLVTGYRSDVFTSRPFLPATKSLKTTTATASSSYHGNKQTTPKTHHSFRWKTKPSNTARVNNYPDPMYSADSAFLQRVTEMASLEVETVKTEKWKKMRRK